MKCPYCAKPGHELAGCPQLREQVLNPDPKFNGLRSLVGLLQEHGFEGVMRMPNPDAQVQDL